MRAFLLILSISLLWGCNEGADSNTDQEPSQSETSTEETSLRSNKIENIEFDAQFDWEANVKLIWKDKFDDEPELLGNLEVSAPFAGQHGLFFVISDFEGVRPYTLTADEEWNYTLEEIPVSKSSALDRYGNSSSATPGVYDISFQEDEKSILVSYEIYGMTEAEDGDGLVPFQKIQHDIFSLNDADKLVHDEEATKQFNATSGVKLNEDSQLSELEFLGQKYYTPLSKEDGDDKLETFLEDMEVLTDEKSNRQNVFQPVRETDDGNYVNDLGYNEYDAFFIPHSNDFELQELDYYDYPVFYVEDHGLYVYSISYMKVDSDVIKMELDKQYFWDEVMEEYDKESAPALTVIFKYVNQKVGLSLSYQSIDDGKRQRRVGDD